MVLDDEAQASNSSTSSHASVFAMHLSSVQAECIETPDSELAAGAAVQQPTDGDRKKGLTADTAVAIYLRKHERSPALTAEFAQAHGITGKAVRDVWARKTWMQETMPYWQIIDEQPLLQGSSAGSEANAAAQELPYAGGADQPELATTLYEPVQSGVSTQIADPYGSGAGKRNIIDSELGIWPHDSEHALGCHRWQSLSHKTQAVPNAKSKTTDHESEGDTSRKATPSLRHGVQQCKNDHQNCHKNEVHDLSIAKRKAHDTLLNESGQALDGSARATRPKMRNESQHHHHVQQGSFLEGLTRRTEQLEEEIKSLKYAAYSCDGDDAPILASIEQKIAQVRALCNLPFKNAKGAGWVCL